MIDVFNTVKAMADAFDRTLHQLAWNLADGIVALRRQELVHNLTEVSAHRPKLKKLPAKVRRALLNEAEAKHPPSIEASLKKVAKKPPRFLRIAGLLDKGTGIWSRDGGKTCYRVESPGKEPETYILQNLTTNKFLNVTLKTLVSRWKHTP